MFRPEPLDLVLILLVAFFLFGSKRLPETAGALGKAIREFRDAITGKDTDQPTNGSKSASSDSRHDSA